MTTFARSRTFEHVPVDLGYEDMETVEVDGRRQYVIPSKTLAFKTYPSITTVLGHGKNYALENWKKRVGEAEAERVTRVACARGTALHSLTERYVRNDESVGFEEAMPDVRSMFSSLLPEINKRIGRVYLQERPLYSDHLRVAGRTDLIAEFDGRLSVIDYKTSSRVKTRDDIEGYFMQTSAYCVMFEERTGIPVDRVAILMAVAGRSEPIVFVEKRDNWIDKLLRTINEYEKAHGAA